MPEQFDVADCRCPCQTCQDGWTSTADFPASSKKMIVCDSCGHKRCPHATFHGHACTGSNESGQPGSRYGGLRFDNVNEALEAEIARLRQRLLTAAGDDLCRLTQEEIKAMSAGSVKIPPKEEFLASCERFHAQVANEVGVMDNCLTLAQLVAENERLTDELEQLKESNAWHVESQRRITLRS